jgi:hypothetical protein
MRRFAGTDVIVIDVMAALRDDIAESQIPSGPGTRLPLGVTSATTRCPDVYG